MSPASLDDAECDDDDDHDDRSADELRAGLKMTSLRSNPLVVIVRAQVAMHDLQVLNGGGTSHVERGCCERL